MGVPPATRAAIKAINDRYGEGTVVLLGSTKVYNVQRTPTGITALDEALGGGLPQGSIIELYGEPMGGKSTLAYVIIANIQRAGGTAVFIDAEHGLDERWVSRFGVSMDDLVFEQPETGEMALDSVLEFVQGDADIIVVDSVAALAPKEEIEGVEEEGVENKKMALLARLMSKSLRVIMSGMKGRKTVVLFINQFTSDIGALSFYGGGNLITKGGRALKQWARVRLEVLRTEWITSAKAEKAGVFKGRIGQKVQVRVTKSKVSPPFRMCVLNLMYYTKDQLKDMGVKA